MITDPAHVYLDPRQLMIPNPKNPVCWIGTVSLQEPPMPSPDHYIPGVCNIGPAEIRKRQISGWIGFVATLALSGVLFYYDNPPLWRLLIFFPAMKAASGF